MSEELQDVDIKPVEGRRVRNEEGTIILGTTTVTLNSYWRRRLADGDVVTIDAEPETKKGK